MGSAIPLVNKQSLAAITIPQPVNKRQEPTKDKWPRIVHGTSQGARNSSAAQLAGKLVRHFTEHEAWALLSSWNASKNSPPLSEKELLNTFLSIMKKHYGGRLRSHR